MRTRSQVALSLGLALSGGCALADHEIEIGESTAEIVGGTKTNGYPSVGLIYAGFSQSEAAQLCTGTLISDRVVLTAAHCVEFPQGPPTDHYVYFGADHTDDTDPDRIAAVEVQSYIYHPDWNIDDLESGHDLGLVLLKNKVPGAEAPPMLYNRESIEDRVGEQVHLVGWGRTSGSNDDFGVKRQTMTALEVTDEFLMQYGGASANTCQGDSGGPNFMMIDGVEVIAGITSYGNVGCNEYGIGTRVDRFADFIDGYIVNNDPSGVPGGAQGDTTGGTATPPGDGEGEPVSGGCSAAGAADSGGQLGFGLLMVVALGLPWVRRRSGARRG